MKAALYTAGTSTRLDATIKDGVVGDSMKDLYRLKMDKTP
jgi:hypothetical protein